MLIKPKKVKILRITCFCIKMITTTVITFSCRLLCLTAVTYCPTGVTTVAASLSYHTMTLNFVEWSFTLIEPWFCCIVKTGLIERLYVCLATGGFESLESLCCPGSAELSTFASQHERHRFDFQAWGSSLWILHALLVSVWVWPELPWPPPAIQGHAH